MEQSPDPTRFVIRASGKSARLDSDVIEQLEQRGLDIEPIAELPGAFLVKTREGDAEPERVWESLRSEAGPGVIVDPALTDPRGTTGLPTGVITVRFQKGLDNEAIEAFGRKWGLMIEKRNAYIDEQICFERGDPAASRFLPDLIADLNRQTDLVVRAWPETLSQFRRE